VLKEGQWTRGGQVELAQKKRISTYNEFLLQTRESGQAAENVLKKRRQRP